ncbi:hypothetical protein GCM10022221_67650 [Actinocorallia aurea]
MLPVSGMPDGVLDELRHKGSPFGCRSNDLPAGYGHEGFGDSDQT